MLKRVINTRLPLLVYHPAGVLDATYFQAIYQAGALPVLDTEFLDFSRAKKALETLAAQKYLFGVRLSGKRTQLAKWLEQQKYPNLELLVAAPGIDGRYASLSLMDTHTKIVTEVLAENKSAVLTKIEPAAVIVKGNEAGGRVSTQSAFVLLQWYLENTNWPVFVHGGVGLHTGAGIFAAGAAGVVMDSQLYLAKEAPLPENFRQQIRTLAENDTIVVGEPLGLATRFFAKPGTQPVQELKEKEAAFSEQGETAAAEFAAEINRRICFMDDNEARVVQSLFYLGQDAGFASHFAAEGNSVAEMLAAFFRKTGEKLAAIDTCDPLVADSPLAQEHEVDYPVMQGPMANISDTAEFAQAVQDNGGLPFFAIGNLPADLADKVIREGAEKCGTYGAGLVGIEALNPCLADHLETVKTHQVPFALFAGGSPDKVKELEACGIRTYLHTPSLMMLENALQGSCTRFIFEGREAGGHVGNLSSLVLWENALQFLENQDIMPLREITTVFAGGIATATASWFISGMTADLAGRGMKVGILAGSPYLFTREIVESGALTEKYQQVIIQAQKTFLVGQTVGLPLRTVETPSSRNIRNNEFSRLQKKMPLADRKEAFEQDNTCSLLIAAKAFAPDFTAGGKLVHYEPAAHYEKGNFSVGASLSLFQEPLTIAGLHDRFFSTKKNLAENLNQLELLTSPSRQINDEIAVVGMGCILPGANDPQTLWENILSQNSYLAELTPERFDQDLYYDADKSAPDKSYSRIAGEITDFVFDAKRYGYTEKKSKNLSRSQQMVLEAAYRAVADAGYLEPDDQLPAAVRHRTGVILGSCHGNELTSDLHLKYYYPEVAWHLEQLDAFTVLTAEEQDTLRNVLREGMSPAEKYEPVHGVLLNMEAARIAHHLGATGVNYTVDAACATSFAAIDCAVRELLAGTHDVMITGGLNTNLAPETFIGFSKMGALSNDGSYPFDSRANGFVIGEGAGVVVLKRVRQAIADGDRIYGIIRAFGSSSDGKGKAIAAPNPAGQELCMQRCLEKLKDEIRPADIDYIEAHGTSTVMGDDAEAVSMRSFYGEAGAVGISSIKSQIGHLLGGAGAASLIKVMLALQHKTLPPNGGFENPSERVNFENTGLYIIDKPRPWKIEKGKARTAAVSSFGFGGINYHCVISEYTGSCRPRPRRIFSDPGYDFNDDRIVVAGLGVVLPGATSVETFWEKLVNGESTVTSQLPTERFHNEAYARMTDENYHIPMVQAGVVNDYQPNLLRFRIPPKVAERLDRAQIFGLDAADQAIQQAGADTLLAEGNKTAVILGTIPGEKNAESVLRARLAKIERLLTNTDNLSEDQLSPIRNALRERLQQRYSAYNEDTLPGLLSNIISGRIANCFGANGANFVVDASCASATMTFDIACKALQSKEYDYVVAGGVDANLYPTLMISFKRLGLLSDGDCAFFDEKGKGYIMGEGAAVAVLTTYKKAREHRMKIYGEIHGLGLGNSVPEHLLSPSQQALETATNRCYQKVQPTRRQIRHLDVFALSHSLLDTVEMQAMEKAFPHPVRIDNCKPRFGYFKAANPAVVLTKLMLMNHHGQLIPNTSYCPETSLLPPGSVMRPERELYEAGRQPLWFATNIIGIGGNHLHMVTGCLPGFLQESQPAAAGLTGSAATAAAMRTAAEPAASSLFSGNKPLTVALVSGQGAQYPGMMRELYENHPSIRRRLDTADQLFIDQRGYSLLALMFDQSGDRKLNQTENTQPAVFLASACIFDYLAERGFAPDVFIGHSIGEYSALYCHRLLDFKTAFSLVMTRGTLMQQAAAENPGRIMVVLANDRQTQTLIEESGLTDLWVANKNSPQQTAVSGAAPAIDAFNDYLSSRNIGAKKLALSGAFHTPYFSGAAEKMAAELSRIRFNPGSFQRIISNVTAQPYPPEEKRIKELLVQQITSPVEFVQSVTNCCRCSGTRLVETGVGRILTNLTTKMDLPETKRILTAEPRQGEKFTLQKAVEALSLKKSTTSAETAVPAPVAAKTVADSPAACRVTEADDFTAFKVRNAEALEQMAFQQYQQARHQETARRYEKYNFCPEAVVVAGVSVGLPGKSREVFAEDNFEQLLRGANLIDPLPEREKEKIADKNITRVYKKPDGNAEFIDIHHPDEVIQLAGQLGHFDPQEYGLESSHGKAVELAMAAGLEALKDAGIPLVQQYRQMPNGGLIPEGYALPSAMQQKTGVIMTSLFGNTEVMAGQMADYFYETYYARAYEEFESMYYHLMEHAKDREVKDRLTEWFFKVRANRRELGAYKMDRNFIANICSLGSSFFAEQIKAKGPNTLVSSACASTTQAIALAEDWIRTGRCDRVIVIGGEDATSDTQNQWIGSGFLAVGAATIEKSVNRAAKPFDRARNGTILGAGAVGLILERRSTVEERGLRGQAELLGAACGNSAHHTYNFDINNLAAAMADFVTSVEKRHELKKSEYAEKLVFMSHETYTPARGGSADAEVAALKKAYPEDYTRITISNTKGYTGHTLGAAVEDAVLVKALQAGVVPPVANLTDIPEEFRELKLNRRQTRGDFEYGLHLSAGFGSHYAFAFFRRQTEAARENNASYLDWLREITGAEQVDLTISHRTLRAVAVTSQESQAVPMTATETFDSTPDNAPGVTAEDTKTAVCTIIAEHTGYTETMLAPDLDLEADLGIDTVKQVEVFGKICKHFGLHVPEDVRLRDLNTIDRVADFIAGQLEHTGTSRKPATVDTAATETGDTSEKVTPQVISILAEHTGYTEAMLAPDLDLEADLGIDTVKQVEVFGKICKHFGLHVPEDVRLRDLNTIDRVADFIAGQLEHTGTSRKSAAVDTVLETTTPPPQDPADTEPAIGRFVTRLQRVSVPENGDNNFFTGRTFLITCDHYGFAEAFGRFLTRRGGRLITGGPDKNYDIPGNFADPQSIAELIEKNLQETCRNISGIFHFAPLDACFEGDWSIEKQSAAVKAFFLLIKGLLPLLTKPGTIVSLPSFDSVVFPYVPDSRAKICPLLAGLAGMLKTLNKELPHTRMKIVDFSRPAPLEARAEIVRQYAAEISTGNARVECGYTEDGRYELQLMEQPPAEDLPLISVGDTLVITGGARGITMEIVKALAEPYQPQLVILGRSDIQGETAKVPPELTEERSIMNYLQQTTMPTARPLELKRAAQRIRNTRLSAENLEALKAAGATVSYHAVDVTDREKVIKALAPYPRIDGIIHAAGVEESALLEKKDPAAFSRVFDVKIAGMENLLTAIREKDCRYVIAFSSVTAKFGNEAQCDYTAANDMLTKLIMDYSRRNPHITGKVLGWTAWAEVGMAASGTVNTVLKERGVTFLPPARGVICFLNEIADHQETEAVFTGRDRELDVDGHFQTNCSRQSISPDFPLIDSLTLVDGKKAVASRLLDIERDLFLNDHSLDGTPILPGSIGAELMTEAALLAAGGDFRVQAIENFSIPYGIKLLRNKPKLIRIETLTPDADGHCRCHIYSAVSGPQGEERKLHYSGQVILSATGHRQFTTDLPAPDNISWDGDFRDLVYQPERFFMTGRFQTIQEIVSLADGLLVTRLCDTGTGEFLAGKFMPVFHFDPIMMDAMFQSAGILEMLQASSFSLPSGFRRARLYQPIEARREHLCLVRRQDGANDHPKNGNMASYRLELADAEGNLYAAIDGFTMVRLHRITEEKNLSVRLQCRPEATIGT